MTDDLIGKFIGPYQLVEYLGSDGIIDVYAGLHPDVNRDVLVHIAGRFLDNDPVFSTRFRQDAKTLARLRHPNVARIYDFGAIQGGHYLVADSVAGTTLADLIEEVRIGERILDADDVTFLTRQIAAALDSAHSRGLVHKELSPYNVILTRSGQAIVTGFGIALLRGRDESPPSLDQLAYQSPEQIEDSLRATPAADIYALGVILYELLTGQRPFESGSDVDAVLRSLSDSAPDPRYLNESLPGVVAQTVRRALARDPRERFGNAMHMASALEWAYANPNAEELPSYEVAAPEAEDDGTTSETVAEAEQVVVRRRPTRQEERRERKRLRADHERMRKEQEAEERRLLRAQRQEERKAQRLQRKAEGRDFASTWGRVLIGAFVVLALLSAGGYVLRTLGIISIEVDLPQLPVPGSQEVAEEQEPTIETTPTETLEPSVTPSPTALQSSGATPVTAVQFVPLEVGTSAIRIGDGALMQFVPGGQFLMGTNDSRRNLSEQPQHAVVVGDYWIDRYEVSNAQFRLCVDAGFCQPPRDVTQFDNPDLGDYPVFFVNYEQASTYCLWLASRTGQIIGLPTEAQWEKAARWDPELETTRLFPWGNDPAGQERLQFSESGAVRPASPVGTHPAGASAYGVHDMAGNVWEWVADWYDPEYYRRTGVSVDPSGPINGSSRVTRGGSWTREARFAVTTFRNPVRPDTSSNEIGFRCAMTGERPPADSRIAVSPVDAVEQLISLLTEAQDANVPVGGSLSPDDIASEYENWIADLTELDQTLQSGDNAAARSLVTRRLTRLAQLEQSEADFFSDTLMHQLKNGMLWIEEILTPEPTPTPVPSPTATP